MVHSTQRTGGALLLLGLQRALCGYAGRRQVAEVIDFSQADDAAMVAYHLSDTLDDLKVPRPPVRATEQTM